MTDDHSAARDVIAHVIDQDNVGWTPVACTDLAELIIAALTDADFQITRRDPAAGRVCISAEDAKDFMELIDDQCCLFEGAIRQRLREQYNRVHQAITEATTG